jgi:protein phosphatase PTC7
MYSEQPRDANITHHRVQHGDLLVFGTDGVWDNMSPQETLIVVSRLMTSIQAWSSAEDGALLAVPDSTHHQSQRILGREIAGTALSQLLAETIAKEAWSHSRNITRDGPFAKQAQQFRHSENWYGGKEDDICVIVSTIVNSGT